MAKKIKKDIKDVDLGDMVEEVYHCSDPRYRYRRVYLVVAESDSSWHGRNAFACVELESSKEIVKNFNRPTQNVTYKIVG